jgi:putative hydrolase of HD superfamily
MGSGIFGVVVNSERLDQQLHFLMEIDRLKQVERQTAIVGGSRRENTAEHSWHLAMYALILREWSNDEVDMAHVLELCLVHDIVEIDAGDTFAYDIAGHADKEQREQAAADRLFGLLPPDQAQRFRSLWDEYEAQESSESRFANAVDRMQPAMLNHHAGDTSPWRRHGVTVPQAMKRLSPIGNGSEALWQRTQSIISEATRRGNLVEEM